MKPAASWYIPTLLKRLVVGKRSVNRSWGRQGKINAFVVYSGFFLLRSRLRLSTAIEKNMAK